MRKGTNTVVVDIDNKTIWIVEKNNMDSDRIKKNMVLIIGNILFT
jgi:hypothetical protein